MLIKSKQASLFSQFQDLQIAKNNEETTQEIYIILCGYDTLNTRLYVSVITQSGERFQFVISSSEGEWTGEAETRTRKKFLAIF